jgi:phosphoribosylamine--glycine ligase
MDEIIRPTIAGLTADGIRYLGFLYAGLMIGEDDAPRVLEYNCRLGDPEAQPILMRLQSDLLEIVEDALEGRLNRCEPRWSEQAALGVVLASHGYPGEIRTGDPIQGLDGIGDPAVKVFHAGTRREGDLVLTSGGRVLCVTALGEGIAQAQRRCYAAVSKIRIADAHYRTDIGARALR